MSYKTGYQIIVSTDISILLQLCRAIFNYTSVPERLPVVLANGKIILPTLTELNYLAIKTGLFCCLTWKLNCSITLLGVQFLTILEMKIKYYII